ncbi:putative ATPase [Hymenobacter luteus]|uniref:ATPase n=2 Tax=Hymenobacter TaxID=89966 RepID=A0ABR6JSJ7_9BACT|nr:MULTISPECIES: AAA family ATPase [Hymenobacter]MBB4599809.1 putative ATPase [Hymenobacter latericoloratus]MBB6057881.1 putative ATPase [Hymenobacter luteus]
MSASAAVPGYPRLTYLRIKNYRALRDVELRDLTPLTVFIGPNGSGKSTILDALAFLAEAVSGNLQQAWEKRNRFAGMRTRGQEGPIEFEVECFMSDKVPRLRYLLSIDEAGGTVFVSEEKLTEPGAALERIIELVNAEPNPLQTPGYEDIFRINIYERDGNEGRYYTSPSSDPIIYFTHVSPNERASVAPKTLALTKVLTSYRYIHLTDDHLKGYSDAGPREKLSANGDNLPNVLYYLHTKHPEALARISEKLRRWVPGLAEVVTEITSDERLLLRFRDAPFEKPLPAQYMSDGTMRLAALLTLLYEPNATGLLGIEEPENELHPRLLPRLAEELSKATETRHLLVATHSPFLLDALEPEQVWILDRGADGYTQATRTADIPQVKELVEDGSPLGYLWTSNFFRLGDPLAPRTPAAQ